MSFVETVKANPHTLHHPELVFFKDYLLSLGATIPEKRNEEAKEAAEEEAKEEWTMVEEEEEDPGRITTPDTEPFPVLPDFGQAAPTESDMDSESGFKQQATKAASEKEWNTAVECFTKALQCRASGMTVVKRANALLECTPPRPNAAINDCNAALSQNPDSAKAMKVRGRAQRLLGNYVLAAIDLRKGLGMDFDPTTQTLLKEVEQFASKIEAKTNAVRLETEEKERAAKLAARKAAAGERKRKQEEEEAAAAAASQSHGHGHGGGHGHSHGGTACNGDHGTAAAPPPQAEAAPSGMPGFGGMGGMGGMGGGGMGGMGGMPKMPAGMDMSKMMGLMQDPEVMQMIQKPKVMAAFQAMMGGGAPDMSDPDVAAAMALFQKKMPGMMGGGGGAKTPSSSEGGGSDFGGDDVD